MFDFEKCEYNNSKTKNRGEVMFLEQKKNG